jgi:hypothetical protein
MGERTFGLWFLLIHHHHHQQQQPKPSIGLYYDTLTPRPFIGWSKQGRLFAWCM